MSHNASVIIPIIPLLLCDTFSHSLKKQSQIYSWRIAHTYTCVLIQSFSYSLPNSSHDRAVHWSMGHTLREDWLAISQQPTTADSSSARAGVTWAHSHWNFDQRGLPWLWLLHREPWLLWVLLCAVILSCNSPQDRWLLPPVCPFFLREPVGKEYSPSSCTTILYRCNNYSCYHPRVLNAEPHQHGFRISCKLYWLSISIVFVLALTVSGQNCRNSTLISSISSF